MFREFKLIDSGSSYNGKKRSSYGKKRLLDRAGREERFWTQTRFLFESRLRKLKSTRTCKMNTVVHTCNCSAWELKAEGSGFKATFSYKK